MDTRLRWIVVLFASVVFHAVVFAQAGNMPTPSGDMPVPTNGRVIRVAIADLSPTAQRFLLPQIKKDGLKSQGPDAILKARLRNLPREDFAASETRVHYADGYAKSANANINAFGSFSLRLADLKGTPFAQYEFLGYVPEGTAAGGPYSWVARVFRTQSGNSLVLSEWDFSLDDGGILQIEEFLNTNVRENPGTLVKEMNVKSRIALWSLTWVSGSKQFSIYTSCPAPRCPTADQFKALAETLPSAPPKMQAFRTFR